MQPVLKQAVPLQPMQGHDVDYTNGGLQQESLVAASLGRKERGSLQCPKGPGVEIAIDVSLNFHKSQFEWYVTRITIAGTRGANGGEALQEAFEMQQ